ncbi:MAG: asparagine synthase (glutamine-hydrolyzing) [Novosphingobium sp.]
MCGLAGFLEARGASGDDRLASQAKAMADCIQHRGPDDGGLWTDAAHGYAVGHRRLAIIDLSAAGHQPMHSVSGRYVLAYNGEVYNHEELRAALEAAGWSHGWRGHSDTEVLLAGIEIWGLAETLRRATGMFALALWDRQDGTLRLARDRLGEKPLYYGWQGQGESRAFLFGSELKALRAHPACTGEIDRGALTLLMRHGYVPAPHSIYTGIAKLLPGTILTVSRGQPEPEVESYWSLIDVARRGQAQQFAGSAEEAVDRLEDLATASVRRQMVSDVPLGAFLSGGVDSSTVVALMQSVSANPVKTFTIGFDERGFDEAHHAKAVARHLGTDHHELYVTPQDAQAVIPQLPSFYCEPFADSSQIPTYLVSKMALGHVTVSLSGDAGDELFAGYNRYAMTQKMWSRITLAPPFLRQIAAGAIGAVPPGVLNRMGDMLSGGRLALLGDKLHKGAGVLDSTSIAELYLRLISSETDPADWVIGGHEPATFVAGNRPDLTGLDPVSQMMALDAVSYLPDDILVKVDRASMAVSLESRVPFLDHALVEYAWTLPLAYKIRDGQAKWPLRQVLYRHVPRELIERPKMGFGVPVGEWLRGPLRAWAEGLLAPERLRQEGFWQESRVTAAWAQHLSGQRNFTAKLWPVLMFQAWLEAQKG